MRLHGSVYKMTNLTTGLPYVGSTKLTLELRFTKHLSAARKGGTNKLCVALRANTFTIELLELFEYDHIYELRQREDHFIAVHNSVIGGYNTYRAFVSDKQRLEEGRALAIQYFKNNKAAIKKRVSRKVQCTACGTHGWRGNVSHHEKTAMHARLNVD
jgi:hypothetical protein